MVGVNSPARIASGVLFDASESFPSNISARMRTETTAAGVFAPFVSKREMSAFSVGFVLLPSE